MTSYYLIRTLAMVTMLSDHLGAFFFHDLPMLRAIGRIAFPLYAFGIACGWMYSSQRKDYVVRLAAIALLSQVVYPWEGFNVVVGFVAVFAWLAVAEALGTKHLAQSVSALLWFVTCVTLVVTNVDYAVETMLLIPLNCRVIASSMSSNRSPLWLPSLLYVFGSAAFSIYHPSPEGSIPLWAWLPALIAPIVVSFHKTHTGRVTPWFKVLYTWFYPMHFLVLFVCAFSAGLLS